jgi:hypothetical protein
MRKWRTSAKVMDPRPSRKPFLNIPWVGEGSIQHAWCGPSTHLVLLAVREDGHAPTLHVVGVPGAGVNEPIAETQLAPTMASAAIELSLVDRAVVPSHDALALVRDRRRRDGEADPSMAEVVSPVTGVARAVLESVLPLAVARAFFPLP